MSTVLSILFCVTTSFIIAHGATGTCCYNSASCAMPMFTPWSAFTLAQSTITDAEKMINPSSCCPTSGDVYGNYNGASTADTICRCHDGSDFVAQTCEYNQFSSEANECSDVGSDTGCPDLQSLGGTDSGKCIVSGGDGIIYVPQRCPSRMLCLSGLTHVYGTYYTNSTLYYKGYPQYRIVSEFLDYKIQYNVVDDNWEVFGYQGEIRAYLGVLSGGLEKGWDIIYTQSYTNDVNSLHGWKVLNKDVYPNVYELSETVQVTEGACTQDPTAVPSTSPVTTEPTASPTTTSPTVGPTEDAVPESTTSTDNQRSSVEKRRMIWSFMVVNAVVTYFIYQ
eukprot:271985_1